MRRSLQTGAKWGIADMNFWTRSIAVAAAAVPRRFVALPTAADAGVGDLLVAPTRIVLDGRKGAEVILNNIGESRRPTACPSSSAG